MVSFKIGLFTSQFLDDHFLNEFLIMLSNHPDNQYGVYVGLPGSRLNGGRINTLQVSDDVVFTRHPDDRINTRVGSVDEVTEKFIAHCAWLNREGVSVDLSLTNHRADPEDYTAEMPTAVLDFLNHQRSNNGVVYTNDSLPGYIAQRFPELNLTASIIKFYSQRTAYKEHLSKGEHVVLTHHDAINLRVLSSIEFQRRKRAWIVVTSPCKDDCDGKTADKHYRQIAMYNRGERKGVPDCHCSGEITMHFTDIPRRDLVALGYTSFKVGRPKTDCYNTEISLDYFKHAMGL